MDADVDYLLGTDSSSSSTSEASTRPLTLASAQQLSAQLAVRLTQAAEQLRLTTQAAPATYLAATSAAAQASQQIAALLAGVDRVQQLADTRHVLRLRTAQASEAAAGAAGRLQQSTRLLAGLRAVAEAVGLARRAEELAGEGRLEMAVERLGQAGVVAGRLAGTRVGGLLDELRARVARLVRCAVAEELGRRVAVDLRGAEEIAVTCEAADMAGLVAAAGMLGAEGGAQETATAAAAGGCGEDDVPALSAAADAALARDECADDDAAAAAAVETGAAADVLRAFGDHIVDSVVRPVLQHSAISVGSAGSTLSIALGRAREENAGGDTSEAAEAACRAIEAALAHIERQTGSRPWTAATLEHVCRLVARRFIVGRPPGAPGTAAAVALEDALVGRVPLAGRPVRRAAAEAERAYARARGSQLLARARGLGEDSALALYQGAPGEGDEPLWPPGLPACAVSLAAVQVLRLVGAPELSAAERARALAVFLAAREHVLAAQLRSIPGVQLLFASDCLLLALHSAGNEGTAAGAAEPPVAAPLLLAAADRAYDALVERQGAELAGLAAPAEAFMGPLGEKAVEARGRALRQAGRALRLLGGAVEPPAAAESAGGRLVARCVDCMYAAVVARIVALDDVGAEESRVLAEYCRSVGALGRPEIQKQQQQQQQQRGDEADEVDEDDGEDDLLLLDGGDGGQEELASRDADRLRQLADVLELPRADILARRRAGLLANFSVAELTHLVRALFSATPERQRDIDLLQTL
ncbi:hypothetical protein LPJ53_001607 [Coemansia erecta]|uniref:Uncharacterized protein n=1 Tax=Coemansia erecta TaxID=147472 RepID=A0A9W7Y324_9FUNG|nr:hypothetical protein LPJ53_001607 [Coemansia erecta]